MTDRKTADISMADEDTCKAHWRFELSEDEGKTIITDLQIDEREKRAGCKGHPQTICALVKGQALDNVDSDALAEADCARGVSCGQALAKCVRQLRDE